MKVFLITLGLMLCQSTLAVGQHPASIEGLSLLAKSAKASVSARTPAPPLPGLEQQTLTFESDGLSQYALLQRPVGEAPEGGWPVVVFAHGFHPNPPDYGRRSSDGVTDRPGDYYRAVPQAYARAGFAVLTPDYRGHNDSEGGEYTGTPLSRNWYSRDLIAAIKTLPSLGDLNSEQLFISGHSMGGPITMNALLALGDQVIGATVWSGGLQGFYTGAAGKEVQKALKNGRAVDFSKALQEVEQAFSEHSPALSPESAYFGHYLQRLSTPLLIHHADGDGATAFAGSVALASRLQQLGKRYRFYPYDSDNHLFAGENFKLAIEGDVQFFRALMAESERPRGN